MTSSLRTVLAQALATDPPGAGGTEHRTWLAVRALLDPGTRDDQVADIVTNTRDLPADVLREVHTRYATRPDGGWTSYDPCERVLVALATHPGTPEDVLTLLAGDSNSKVVLVADPVTWWHRWVRLQATERVAALLAAWEQVPPARRARLLPTIRAAFDRGDVRQVAFAQVVLAELDPVYRSTDPVTFQAVVASCPLTTGPLPELPGPLDQSLCLQATIAANPHSHPEQLRWLHACAEPDRSHLLRYVCPQLLDQLQTGDAFDRRLAAQIVPDPGRAGELLVQLVTEPGHLLGAVERVLRARSDLTAATLTQVAAVLAGHSSPLWDLIGEVLAHPGADVSVALPVLAAWPYYSLPAAACPAAGDVGCLPWADLLILAAARGDAAVIGQAQTLVRQLVDRVVTGHGPAALDLLETLDRCEAPLGDVEQTVRAALSPPAAHHRVARRRVDRSDLPAVTRQ